MASRQTLTLLASGHYAAQIGITMVVAALLSGSYRVFGRSYLRHWAISWWAFCTYRAVVAASLLMAGERGPSGTALAVTLLPVTSALQLVYLMAGAWDVSHARELSTRFTWQAALAAVAAALGQSLFLMLAPRAAQTGGTAAARLLPVAAAAVVSAVWLARSPRADAVGHRLLPWALVLWAASAILTLLTFALVEPSETSLIALSAVDLAVQSMLAVAIVLWLLGEERARERERAEAEAGAQRAETMAVLGSLVAGVAHEVRSPLFGITATLDLLRPRLAGRPEFVPLLGALGGEVGRLSSLMNDLLEYARPAPTDLERCEIGAVVAEAIGAARPLSAERCVEVEAPSSRPSAGLMMDRRRLVQVFHNLVDNAVRHSPPGGRVRVRLDEEGGRGRLACSVEDDGPGFPPGEEARVFTPFFTRRKGGTGLGLSIAKRIVDQHGGEIEAANRPGGGARVTVRLPVEGA